MKLVKKILKISRPRFWIYTSGPFLLGGVFAIDEISNFLNLKFLYLLFYFTFIANLLIYTVNDYFDYDTDILNKKKQSQESHYEKNERNLYRVIIAITLIVSIFTIFLLETNSKILLICFIFLACFYSVPPFRFKSKIILDFVSNIFYLIPGILAYEIISPIDANYLLIPIFGLWTAAMQLFSAVPDIIPDKASKIRTSAVFFGEKLSLGLVIFMWGTFATALIMSNFIYLPLLVYPLLGTITFVFPKRLNQIYWYFPYINFILGGIYFFILLI